MSHQDRQFLIHNRSAAYFMSRSFETLEPIKDRFDRILVQAIDEGLLVFGESTRYVIYYHIASKHNIERERIPERLEAFHEALKDIFGEGSKVVEKQIAKSMYAMLDLKFRECDEWTLVDYANDARETAEYASARRVQK